MLHRRWAAALAGLGALIACVPAHADLRVRGTTLVDGRGWGHVVTLRGVNRSGLEYTCINGQGFFDSPHPGRIDDPGMIAAMKGWNINVVRVPLNENCWLGVNAPTAFSGAAYRRIVERYVQALNRAGLYVILDLHWAAPGALKADHQLPMADQDHAPAFWHSIALSFRHDPALIFDLFNEPYVTSWSCWLHGCQVPAGAGGDRAPAYRTAGMQSLVDAVRSAGARQPLLLGGIGYASDDSAWLSHQPRDSRHNLIAAQHNYGGLSPCDANCRAMILSVHRQVPVLMGELGETDCAHSYIDAMMPFADAHGIGYLGWAWDSTQSGWSCASGPSLIQNYAGTPSPFGIGFRDHLRSLATPFRP